MGRPTVGRLPIPQPPQRDSTSPGTGLSSGGPVINGTTVTSIHQVQPPVSPVSRFFFLTKIVNAHIL